MSEPRPPGPDARVIALVAVAAVVVGLVGVVIVGLLTHDSSDGPASTGDAVCPAIAVADQALPSVVTISVAGPDGQSGNGTGELIRDGGYVLTNQHVIAPAGGGEGQLTVRYSDGTTSTATLVGEDVPTDLAVLRAEDHAEGRPLIDTGSSSDLRVGSPVVALGAPLGLVSSVTSGIVSGLGRYVPVPTDTGQTHHLVDAIQTDAAINPGNSGGPLVDCAGAMVGVNSAIATVPNAEGVGGGGSVGLGFAIPVGIAGPIADQVIETGSANHPVLGLAAQPLPAEDGEPVPGLFVTLVLPEGPAAIAGMAPGDVITEINGATARSPDQLVVATLGRSPGDVVTLTYRRGGTSHTVDIPLAAP